MNDVLQALILLTDHAQQPKAVCDNSDKILHANRLWQTVASFHSDNVGDLFDRSHIKRIQDTDRFTYPLVIKYPSMPNHCVLYERFNAQYFTVTLLLYAHKDLLCGKYDDLSGMTYQLSSSVFNSLQQAQLTLNALSGRFDERLDHDNRIMVDSVLQQLLVLNHITREFDMFTRLQSGTLALDTQNTVLKYFLISLADTIHQLVRTNDIHMYVSFELDNQICAIDQKLVTFALTSLVSNAIRSFDPRAKDKRIVFSAECNDNCVCLTVTDNGTGLSAEELERAFIPFNGEPSRFNGSTSAGLGLNLCASLANLWGGTVSLTSDGKETRATLTIPLKENRNQGADFLKSDHTLLQKFLDDVSVHLANAIKLI